MSFEVDFNDFNDTEDYEQPVVQSQMKVKQFIPQQNLKASLPITIQNDQLVQQNSSQISQQKQQLSNTPQISQQKPTVIVQPNSTSQINQNSQWSNNSSSEQQKPQIKRGPIKIETRQKGGFKTGGLTQIAQPSYNSYDNDQSNADDSIIEEQENEEEHDNEEDQLIQQELNNLNSNSIQNNKTATFSKPDKQNVTNITSAVGNNQLKEEKIIIHNKNLLMDLVPTENIQQKQSQPVTSFIPQKQDKNASNNSISSSVNTAKISQKNYGGLAQLKKQQSAGGNQQKVGNLQRVQQIPGSENTQVLNIEKKPSVKNLGGYSKQQSNSQQKESSYQNAQQMQSQQLQTQAPLNQINIVSNSNQFNTFQNQQPITPQMFLPQQQQQQQLQPQQQFMADPSMLLNNIQNMGLGIGATGNNGSYSEQLQSQLNMIMQMHNQLQQQIQTQNGIASNPFTIQQPQQIPQNNQFPNAFIPQLNNQMTPSGSSSLQNPYLMQQQPNLIQQQQLNQAQNVIKQQPPLTKITAKPIVSQMSDQPSAFKQNYPQDSLFSEFKDSLQQEASNNLPHQPPKLNNYALNHQPIITNNNNSNNVLNSNQPITQQRSKYSMSQDNFQSQRNNNHGRISNFGDQISDTNSNFNYMDTSAQKSQISSTSQNYMPQSQPSLSNNQYRSSKKMEAQTDTFKYRKQPLSQVRPSITNSQAGQSILNFKPYSQKDYSNMQQTAQQRFGGLGANIGTEEWEKAKQKKDQISQFAQNVKLQNQMTLKQQVKPPKAPEPKEKTAREKAIEFAKSSVPKPKQKADAQKDQNSASKNNKRGVTNQDLENEFGIDDQTDFGLMENRVISNFRQKNNDMAMLDQKHEAYLDEVEKIKRAFNIKN
eukprot:403366128